MARPPKLTAAHRNALVREPAPGTILVAPTGGKTEIEFDVTNDTETVNSFQAEVFGLPAEWLEGLGVETMVAAFGVGSVRLGLAPRYGASTGDYEFTVRLVSYGAAVRPDVSLMLRVEQGEEPEEIHGEPGAVPEINGNDGHLLDTVVTYPEPAPVTSEPVAVMEPESPVVAAIAPVVEPEPVPPILAAEPPLVEAAPEPVAAAEPPPSPPVAPVVESVPVAAAEPPPVFVELPPPVQAAESIRQETPAVEPIVAPQPPPAVVAAEPVATAPEPAPVFVQPAPPVIETPPVVTPEPEPAPEPAPPPVVQSQPSAPPVQARTAEPLGQARPVTPPRPEERPRPATATTTPRPTAPQPPPAEERIVDLKEEEEKKRREEEERQRLLEAEEPPAPVEQSILNPKDGALLKIRPGEKLLVRFSFTNEERVERTFILDDDRTLPGDWITLEQDQVNLARNGTGEVKLRLTPPLDAEPGEYNFTVTVGPQGSVLTPIALVLSVLATPAVNLAAKEKLVKINPFGYFADFHLVVGSQGNSDTAFRIAVRTMRPKADSNGAQTGNDLVYETPQWRYLFDKEMETLRRTTPGRPPQPYPIKLRLLRKGPWWFGFRETHKVRVVAVPVTEPENGGKGNNAVELTAMRWRIVPFPIPILAALFVMMMFLLTGGVSSMDVSNADYHFSNTYWIVGKDSSENKPAELSWTASMFAFLRLTGDRSGKNEKHQSTAINQVVRGSGTFSTVGKVYSDDRMVSYNYRVSRLIGEGGRDVNVNYIFTRKDTPLQVDVLADNKGKLLSAPHSVAGDTVELTVPETKDARHPTYARLSLTNETTEDLSLTYYLAKPLSPKAAFVPVYLKSPGDLKKGMSDKILFKQNPDASDDDSDNELVLITSDANRPVLHIRFKAGWRKEETP